VLVLGNEISGVDPEVLNKADTLIHIPMSGTKTSINVAVAAGVALYWFAGNLNQLRENG
jgi:tRNA G18 (ribose-2'-O)-methylase SpoU